MAISRRTGTAVSGASRTVLTIVIVVVAALALGLAGCSRSDRGKSSESTKLSKRIVPIGQRAPKGGGRYKVGNPYKIAGRWYYPKENERYDNVGIASWYGDLFHGRRTANGEIFDMYSLTAAHPTLPMPTYAQVTNLENGRSIVVRINDRGPYAHDREIDLSKRSAQMLGVYRPGTAKVRVRYLGKAPLSGDDSYERQVLASQPWARVAEQKAPRIYAKAVADTVARSDRRIAAEPSPAPMTVASVKQPLPRRKPAVRGWTPVEKRAAVVPSSPRRRGRLVFVQAGSFRSEQNANAVRERLSQVGRVHVYPAEVSGTIWYRVRVGPFKEPEAAGEALQKVVAAGARGARLVTN